MGDISGQTKSHFREGREGGRLVNVYKNRESANAAYLLESYLEKTDRLLDKKSVGIFSPIDKRDISILEKMVKRARWVLKNKTRFPRSVASLERFFSIVIGNDYKVPSRAFFEILKDPYLLNTLKKFENF